MLTLGLRAGDGIILDAFAITLVYLEAVQHSIVVLKYSPRLLVFGLDVGIWKLQSRLVVLDRPVCSQPLPTSPPLHRQSLPGSAQSVVSAACLLIPNTGKDHHSCFKKKVTAIVIICTENNAEQLLVQGQFYSCSSPRIRLLTWWLILR